MMTTLVVVEAVVVMISIINLMSTIEVEVVAVVNYKHLNQEVEL